MSVGVNRGQKRSSEVRQGQSISFIKIFCPSSPSNKKRKSVNLALSIFSVVNKNHSKEKEQVAVSLL